MFTKVAILSICATEIETWLKCKYSVVVQFQVQIVEMEDSWPTIPWCEHHLSSPTCYFHEASMSPPDVFPNCQLLKLGSRREEQT